MNKDEMRPVVIVGRVILTGELVDLFNEDNRLGFSQ